MGVRLIPRYHFSPGVGFCTFCRDNLEEASTRRSAWSANHPSEDYDDQCLSLPGHTLRSVVFYSSHSLTMDGWQLQSWQGEIFSATLFLSYAGKRLCWLVQAHYWRSGFLLTYLFHYTVSGWLIKPRFGEKRRALRWIGERRARGSSLNKARVCSILAQVQSSSFFRSQETLVGVLQWRELVYGRVHA